MGLVDRSTLHFVAVLLGACLLFAGAGGFFALHDQDWKYSYDRAEDSSPDNEGSVEYYAELSPEERKRVDRAIAGETLRFETEQPVPPAVVRKDETYHVFDRFTVFDFTARGTYSTLAALIAGIALMTEGARRDVRS